MSDKPQAPTETESITAKHKPDDREIGEAFIRRYAGKYAFLWGEWYGFNAKRGIWQPAARQIFRDCLDLINEYKPLVSVSRRRAEAVLAYCELYLPHDDHIAHNPDLIPLANGCYNIRTASFEPHKSENYYKSSLDFDYEEDAPCSEWLKTLRQIIVKPDGSTDWDTIQFLQEAFGYAMWGDNRLQASFFLYGDGGTGKSTVLEVLQSLTESTTTIDLETLDDYQMASLVDVRVVVFNELEEGASFPEAAFKRLVSSDSVKARQPYGRPFTFKPICTVFGAMNSLPRVKDRTRGVFRRVYVVPFLRRVENPDPYLIQKLKAERAGIFEWAMIGLKRIRNSNNTFHPSEAVLSAVEDWRYENDIERQFLKSNYCLLGKEYKAQSAALYAAYKAWCYESGYKPKSINRMAKDWRRLGLTEVKASEVYWHGVGIKGE